MPVTVKISEPANALAEAYLGHIRSVTPRKKGQARFDKQDMVSDAVTEYVKNHLPPTILREITKAQPS